MFPSAPVCILCCHKKLMGGLQSVASGHPGMDRGCTLVGGSPAFFSYTWLSSLHSPAGASSPGNRHLECSIIVVMFFLSFFFFLLPFSGTLHTVGGTRCSVTDPTYPNSFAANPGTVLIPLLFASLIRPSPWKFGDNCSTAQYALLDPCMGAEVGQTSFSPEFLCLLSGCLGVPRRGHLVGHGLGETGLGVGIWCSLIY